MKINSIYIISFGGLKNTKLDFKNGLNCIYGENEKGKTTIMSFIKMMFYGNERGSNQISKNLRKKYTPWDGSAMAGSIEFELGGKEYRLEREFRSSNSTDKVSITDLSLGEKQPAEADIGVRLFGLSASAFERSIFIGQLGFPENDASAESELNTRLSNIVSTGDEKLSLEGICKKLEKARYAIISKTSRAGEYYKNFLVAKELGEKLELSINSNNQYNEGKKKLSEYTAETDLLIKKANGLKNQIAKEQDIKNAQKLRELLETKDALEEVKKELTLNDGSPADENFLRNLKFASNKLENAKNKVKAKEKEIEIVENQLNTLINGPKLSSDQTPESLTEELLKLDKDLILVNNQIGETKAKINELHNKRTDKSYTNKPFNIPLLITGIILFVLGIATLVISPVVTIAISIFAGVMTALGFAVKPKNNKKLVLLEDEISSLSSLLNSKEAHAKDLETQISERKTVLEAIKLSATANNEVIEKQRTQLSKIETELILLKENEMMLNGELSSLLGTLANQGDNIAELLDALEINTAKQKELKQHINFLLRDLDNISYEDAKAKLTEIENSNEDISADFTSLKEEYDSLVKEISERKATESSIDTQLKALVSGVENPEILKKKLEEINTLLAEQKAFCDSIDIALKTLSESFSTLRSSFGSELEKKSAEIFAKLTDGKYNNMIISKSFGINVADAQNPISREAEYLSGGTFDQAYLSMRLAVASLLGAKLPLFLDDSLTQYDETRAKATIEFLKDYTENSQAIMFTCHKSIFESSKNLGCETNSL